jgi:hypothetical protein
MKKKSTKVEDKTFSEFHWEDSISAYFTIFWEQALRSIWVEQYL